MTKSTITRERLQQIIRVIDGEAYDEEEIREWLSSDEIMELSRMALAAMDREPVAEVCEDYAIRYISSGPAPKEGLHPGDKLYRHAQPVVLNDGRADFEAWMLMRWGRERRDDDFAMGKFIYGEDYADSYTRCVWKAWFASRAAMLSGGKS